MSTTEDKLKSMGLVLPAPMQPPPGVVLPFVPVRMTGDRAVVSGHAALKEDGTLYEPRGKVGGPISLEEGKHAAMLTGLAILSSLKGALGDLDRITAWVRVFGMVNSAPGFNQQPAVINGFSELILEVFGPDVGAHSRSAVGMAELPFDFAVEIEAEVTFS